MVAQVEVAGKSGYLTAFKILIALSGVAVLVQAVSAGQLLSGGSSGLHAAGAGAVHLLQLLTFVAGILVWRPGRGPAWPALASLVAMLLGFVQSAVGGSGAVIVHVPLGMALFGITVWLVVWSWRSPR